MKPKWQMKLMAENTFLYIDEAKMANETNG